MNGILAESGRKVIFDPNVIEYIEENADKSATIHLSSGVVVRIGNDYQDVEKAFESFLQEEQDEDYSY